VCACALSAVVAGVAGCSDRSATEAPAVPWREDPRLRPLFDPCPPRGHFDADTSHLLPSLVAKLSSGQLEVVRHLREELAASGDMAIAELDREIRRHYTSRLGIPVLRNALGVLRLSDSPLGREVLARCLEHPHEDVRAQAVRGLVRHGSEAEYDALQALLPVSAPDLRSSLAQAMWTCDPRRLAATLTEWVADLENADLWGTVARAMAADGAREADTLEPLLGEVLPADVRPFVLAAAARGGSVEALAEIEELLGDDDPQRRTWALEAAELAGRAKLGLALMEDGEETLRTLAASLLAAAEADGEVRAALHGGLKDRSRAVRQASLTSLLSLGDEAAADVALSMLDGGPREMEISLLSLRGHWDARPGLARAALATLERRLGAVEGETVRQRQALFQAVGQVPLEQAGHLLLERARTEPGELHRMSAHRWLVRQAGNTPEGRAVLAGGWQDESDPRRRLDLIEAVAFGSDDLARDFLFGVIRSERAAPHELLYAADRSVRLGPASEVASLLKRRALALSDPEVRPALQCLLWRWYGPPVQ
jgi:hypothetical protein